MIVFQFAFTFNTQTAWSEPVSENYLSPQSSYPSLHESMIKQDHFFKGWQKIYSPAKLKHIHRVTRLAMYLGQKLGLDETSMNHLLWAARLHDIGGVRTDAENHAIQILKDTLKNHKNEIMRHLRRSHLTPGLSLRMAYKPHYTDYVMRRYRDLLLRYEIDHPLVYEMVLEINSGFNRSLPANLLQGHLFSSKRFQTAIERTNHLLEIALIEQEFFNLIKGQILESGQSVGFNLSPENEGSIMIDDWHSIHLLESLGLNEKVVVTAFDKMMHHERYALDEFIERNHPNTGSLNLDRIVRIIEAHTNGSWELPDNTTDEDRWMTSILHLVDLMDSRLNPDNLKKTTRSLWKLEGITFFGHEGALTLIRRSWLRGRLDGKIYHFFRQLILQQDPVLLTHMQEITQDTKSLDEVADTTLKYFQLVYPRDDQLVPPDNFNDYYMKPVYGWDNAYHISYQYPHVHTEPWPNHDSEELTLPLKAALYPIPVITISVNSDPKKTYLLLIRRSVQSRGDPGRVAFPGDSVKADDQLNDGEDSSSLYTRIALRGLEKKLGIQIPKENIVGPATMLKPTNTAPKKRGNVYRMYVVVPMAIHVNVDRLEEVKSWIDSSKIASSNNRDEAFQSVEEVFLLSLQRGGSIHMYQSIIDPRPYQGRWGEHMMTSFLYSPDSVVRLDGKQQEELLYGSDPYVAIWGVSGRVLREILLAEVPETKIQTIYIDAQVGDRPDAQDIGTDRAKPRLSFFANQENYLVKLFLNRNHLIAGLYLKTIKIWMIYYYLGHNNGDIFSNIGLIALSFFLMVHWVMQVIQFFKYQSDQIQLNENDVLYSMDATEELKQSWPLQLHGLTHLFFLKLAQKFKILKFLRIPWMNEGLTLLLDTEIGSIYYIMKHVYQWNEDFVVAEPHMPHSSQKTTVDLAMAISA